MHVGCEVGEALAAASGSTHSEISIQRGIGPSDLKVIGREPWTSIYRLKMILGGSRSGNGSMKTPRRPMRKWQSVDTWCLIGRLLGDWARSLSSNLLSIKRLREPELLIP